MVMTKCPDHPGVRMVINVEVADDPVFWCPVCHRDKSGKFTVKREDMIDLKALRELPTYNAAYGA